MYVVLVSFLAPAATEEPTEHDTKYRNEDAPAQIPGIIKAADEMKLDGPRKS